MPSLSTPVPEKAKPFPVAEMFHFAGEYAMAPFRPKPGVAALPKSPHTPQIPSQDTRRVCRIDLGGGDGLAGAGTTLPGVQADLVVGNSDSGLLHNLLGLGEDKLDVAGVGHVRVDLDGCQSWDSCFYRFAVDVACRKYRIVTYATVSTVSSATLLGGLVDLDVLDDQSAGVEALGVGVGLRVLEQLEQELGGLDGPASAGHTPSLACLSLLSASSLVSSIHHVPLMLSPAKVPRVDSIQALVIDRTPSSIASPRHVSMIAAGTFAVVESGRVVPWAVRPMEPQ